MKSARVERYAIILERMDTYRDEATLTEVLAILFSILSSPANKTVREIRIDF